MTESYIDIQKKIEALQLKAEKLRAKEIEGVVARIRVAIDHYGLTSEQLFGSPPKNSKDTQKSNTTRKSIARYADASGNAWSGMGKRPGWLRDALAAGRKLEEFATAPVAPEQKPSGKSAATTARTTYRDEAGNAWSGMGPRPRWLKEALENGKTLAELTS